jgi:hypothetical protein
VNGVILALDSDIKIQASLTSNIDVKLNFGHLKSKAQSKFGKHNHS